MTSASSVTQEENIDRASKRSKEFAAFLKQIKRKQQRQKSNLNRTTYGNEKKQNVQCSRDESESAKRSQSSSPYSSSSLSSHSSCSSALFLHNNPALNEPSIRRVLQLDAYKLDHELYHILYNQLSKAFSLFNPAVIERIEPEIALVVKIVIYGMSVFHKGTTYGNKLQNLWLIRQRDGKPLGVTRKYILGFLSICGSWVFERVSRYVISKRWGEERDLTSLKFRFWRVFSTLESLLSVLNAVNFLLFLKNGVYLTPLYRVLGISFSAPSSSSSSLPTTTTSSSSAQSISPSGSDTNNSPQVPHVSFDLMNRQLLWHGFSEFVFFILPLVNIARLKNFIVRTFFSFAPPFTPSWTKSSEHHRRGTRGTRAGRVTAGSASKTSHRAGKDQAQSSHQQQDYTTPATLPHKCLICDSPDINRPYQTPCGHVFCYYCITSNAMADPFYPCPWCGEAVVGKPNTHQGGEETACLYPFLPSQYHGVAQGERMHPTGGGSLDGDTAAGVSVHEEPKGR
eukprot:Nk52_evm16s227 gene=Nk52_evmTU16s227